MVHALWLQAQRPNKVAGGAHSWGSARGKRKNTQDAVFQRVVRCTQTCGAAGTAWTALGELAEHSGVHGVKGGGALVHHSLLPGIWAKHIGASATRGTSNT